MTLIRYQKAVKIGKIAVVLSVINLCCIFSYFFDFYEFAFLSSLVLSAVIIVLAAISLKFSSTGVMIFILVVHILIAISYLLLIWMLQGICIIC